MREPDTQKSISQLAVTRWDLWLGGAFFVAALAIGALITFDHQIFDWISRHPGLATALALAVFLFILSNWRLHRLLRALGDRIGVSEPRPLIRPWVLDGDTIEDRATNIRYRLANIDAPETGDNARCFTEALMGERAKFRTIGLIERAGVVSARHTVRLDPYGRRVAYIEVDGVDLGELLVAQGLARRWRGRREKWCGSRGPLAQMSQRRSEPFTCTACARWKR